MEDPYRGPGFSRFHTTPFQRRWRAGAGVGYRASEDDSVTLFVVERNLSGLAIRDLLALQRVLAESARRLSDAGEPVRYIRSTFLPRRSRCYCVFEAASTELVRKTNETAQIPFLAIDEAIELET